MKRKGWGIVLFFALLLSVSAGNRVYEAAYHGERSAHIEQTPQTSAWNGTYYNEEHRVTLRLHLDEATLEAPGYAFLGKVRGYMHGGIYNTWLLTDFSERRGVLTLRMSNDSGSDVQQIELEQLSDSLFSYRAVGGNEVRRAVGRKLVKIPSTFTLTRR